MLTVIGITTIYEAGDNYWSFYATLKDLILQVVNEGQ